MRYTYCSQCGKMLIGKSASDDGEVPYCDSCRKFWFDSFSSCVIILVVNEYHEIAMRRQNYLSDQYWTYVAGYIKPGETTSAVS